MKNLHKYISLLAIPFLMAMASCSEEKYPDTSGDLTVIQSIKIINGGTQGDSIINGKVNELKKEITFNPIPTASKNLAEVRFEVVVSDRASLDSVKYNFVIPDGDAKLERIISVVNGLRKREYNVILEYDLPPIGADFNKAVVYDNSLNPEGNSIYPDYTGQTIRWSDFDKDQVLLVSRTGGMRPHIIKMTDILNNNNVSNPVLLDQTNASGVNIVDIGTYKISSGCLTQGGIYVSNLAGMSAASPLRIYYWATPTSKPIQIFSEPAVNLPAGTLGRYGDNMSMSLDATGNGYIYFGDNTSRTNILRLKVTDFTSVKKEDAAIVSTIPGATAWVTVNQIGDTDEYIADSYESKITLVDENCVEIYTMTNTDIPLASASTRIVEFFDARYLITVTAARSGTSPTPSLLVYDITKGTTVKKALQLFDKQKDKKPAYQFSLFGSYNSAPGANVNYAIDGETLYLFASCTDAGFVVAKLPKKVKEIPAP